MTVQPLDLFPVHIHAPDPPDRKDPERGLESIAFQNGDRQKSTFEPVIKSDHDGFFGSLFLPLKDLLQFIDTERLIAVFFEEPHLFLKLVHRYDRAAGGLWIVYGYDVMIRQDGYSGSRQGRSQWKKNDPAQTEGNEENQDEFKFFGELLQDDADLVF